MIAVALNGWLIFALVLTAFGFQRLRPLPLMRLCELTAHTRIISLVDVHFCPLKCGGGHLLGRVPCLVCAVAMKMSSNVALTLLQNEPRHRASAPAATRFSSLRLLRQMAQHG